MARQPQNPELLTSEEIAAIKRQLSDFAELCSEAEQIALKAIDSGLYVLYKPGLIRAMDGLLKAQGNLYQSILASKMGKPMNANSISPRAKRIAKAKAQVTEVRKQLRKKD
jgi:hypothetical protein